MARVKRVIAKIEPHDSAERYRSLGVNVYSGTAKIISPWEILINDEIISARTIIIATGAQPLIPAIRGIDRVPYLTSETIWDLKALPKKLIVLGGGPIGIELAQTFARLTSDVTLIEGSDMILNREDSDVSEFLKQVLELSLIHI